MPRDECNDCEQHFPEGKGLKDGLCKGCRAARRAMKAEVEGATEHEGEPKEE